MRKINQRCQHDFWDINNSCCFEDSNGRRVQQCCSPRSRPKCARNRCMRNMTILSVKFLREVKKRNLKKIEPEEDDDGELQDSKDDTEAPVSKFSGKKKGKAKKVRSNNALSASSFGLLGEGDDEDNEDSGIAMRMLIKKNQDNEVAGFAPNEKQITELLTVGKDKRALKVAKRKMRAAEGGEKKK